MELVALTGAVGDHNRIETDILEALQAAGFGNLGVEAGIGDTTRSVSGTLNDNEDDLEEEEEVAFMSKLVLNACLPF